MSKDELKKNIQSQSKVRQGTSVEKIQKNFHQDEDPKSHTLSIKPSKIDKLKDYVHFVKLNGKPYYTQGDALEEALELLFIKTGELPERPEEIKRKEQKRTGRRKAGPTNQRKNDSDIFS